MTAPPDVITAAVLPFVNLGPDPEGQYFCNGLTQELIHTLTNARGMRLVAWSGDDRQDSIAIARQLQVASLLKGSVSINGARLRVRSHLIDVSSAVYIQSETFDRELRDIFAIQEELARAISELQRKQIPSQFRALSRPAHRFQ